MESDPQWIESAIVLAREIQRRALEVQTPPERRQQAELDRMLQTPTDKVTMVEMTDQAFRSHRAARTADQFTHILDVQGIPRFFSPLDRALLRGFQTFGGWLPGVTVPLVRDRVQSETANVVVPAEVELLSAHLAQRREAGIRTNVNFLGEALLGEAEASARLERYLAALQIPEIEVISVKISTLYSQISSLAREHTLAVLCDRLERLYRASADAQFTRSDGTTVPKFIYLDMEEYRDLSLTAEAFMRTLDRPGLNGVSAGIALQAYVPDSARVQRRINEWARPRVAAGGGRVTIRIVKGANMEMERVEAALRGWPQAPFKTKRETDANYKQMLRVAMRTENLAAVSVGIASHNLFDLAYGLVLAAQAEAGARVQFEMLEGMANAQRRALFEHTQNLLLYAPACRKEEFLNAIGYLIRRLDENTGPENFLRHAFKLHVGSGEWKHLERGFRESFALEVPDAPRRTQDRAADGAGAPRAEMPWRQFENEPDTDFSLPQNGEWAARLVGEPFEPPSILPVVVNGEERVSGRGLRDCRDPSRPGITLTRCAQASQEDLAEAVAVAAADADGWWTRGLEERSRLLGLAAQELRNARGALLRAALANGGKTLTESDPEVSEAVDFVEFYRATARHWINLAGVEARPRGAAIVIPPWNFPIAIPCGGVASALAAGNCVILKPASDTALVAWELCRCFWRAGVSRRVLQFVPCSGGDAGAHLLTQPKIGAVILTGGTATALTMLRANPSLPLFAETGGKNATIVTALSDREQAIKHVVHSAFSHGGQKCSATSLLLLEAEVYDDPEFRRILCDAVESIRAGPAWDLSSRMGPLIRPPDGDLQQALTTLDVGESWAVEPHCVGGNPHLWSPGVKWGVRPGSVTHLTEFFGPVLGVMRFTSLAEAIELVNATGYGLTSGLESLDDREQRQWLAGIRAGNLYINKPTTGAIVLRQPFGGMGRSSFGPGMKAGGPNYVAQLMTFNEVHSGEDEAGGAQIVNEDLAVLYRQLSGGAAGVPGQEAACIRTALVSYDRAAREEFSLQHDHFLLLGEDNFRRYLPFREVRVRIDPGDAYFDIFARAAAARAAGCRVIVSAPRDIFLPGVKLLDDLTHSWAGGIEFIEETDKELARAIRAGEVERVRFSKAGVRTPVLLEAAHETGIHLAAERVSAQGRLELLWYLREQSVSHAYHRYGNLGARAGNARAEPL